MEILAALILVACGALLGTIIAVVYYAYNAAWQEEDKEKRILEGRVNVLERDSSKVEDFREHYGWRIEQIEERLKKLEPTEKA
jgi:hypothetical protein